jgi:hypothetical protein
MKISKKVQTRMKLEVIEEEKRLKEEEEQREAKRQRDIEKMKPIMEKKQIAYDAIAKAEAEDTLREQVSPADCLKIVKEVIDQFAELPRIKVIELLKTDEELIKEIEELKRQAQIIFKHVPKDNNVRLAVLSLFKISLDIDLELPYMEDKRKDKKVAFDDKVEEIDPERAALLEKLKSKKK